MPGAEEGEDPVVAGRTGSVRAADGRRVAFLDRGPRDGRPVVYLHGMPGSRFEQMLFSDAALAEAGLRVVSIDRPGWGQTDPLAGDRVARSRDVLVVADALGFESFMMMAVSAGGPYALALAAAAPGRVRRLLLVSAQMPYDDDAAITSLRRDQAVLLRVSRRGRTDALVAGCAEYRKELLADPYARLATSFDTLSPRERVFIDAPTTRRVLAEDMVEGVRISADGLVDDLLAWPHRFEVDLSCIACRVTAVHGTEDDWEPLPNLRRILSLIPDADLWLCESTNHFGPLLHPAAVLALLDDELPPL